MPKEQINVIVHLSEPPIVLQKQTSQKRTTFINQQQQHVLHKMDMKNIPYKLLQTYGTIINALAITVFTKDIHKLHSIPGILLIEPSLEVQAMGNTSIHQTHPSVEEVDPIYEEIKSLWSDGMEGQHIKVSVQWEPL